MRVLVKLFCKSISLVILRRLEEGTVEQSGHRFDAARQRPEHLELWRRHCEPGVALARLVALVRVVGGAQQRVGEEPHHLRLSPHCVARGRRGAHHLQQGRAESMECVLEAIFVF